MSSPGSNGPRKFSEKIAIMERKLNEDEDAFSKVMREVREITSGPSQQPGGLQPGQWNGPGSAGSLPNMLESCSQAPPFWPEPSRGRSPGSHYHPYRAHPRSQERVPPLHGLVHQPPYQVPPPQQFPGLSPPDNWNVVGRAHSAPSINMALHMSPISPIMSPYTSAVPQYHDSSAQHSPVYNNGSPSYNNGSPVYAGGSGSPTNMIPRPEEGQEIVGSLPNMPPNLPQAPGPSCYHAQVGQRHSTGCGTRLAPSFTPESQSAPTSPAQMNEHSLAPVWPIQRHYSNSPEALDIPNIVLTEADGLDASHLDCFDPIPLDRPLDMAPYDLQDLRLDGAEMHRMCNGTGNPSYDAPTSNAQIFR